MSRAVAIIKKITIKFPIKFKSKSNPAPIPRNDGIRRMYAARTYVMIYPSNPRPAHKSLSLSLSLSHTHTHTHTHSRESLMDEGSRAV